MERNSAIATATGTTETPSPRDEALPLLFSGIFILLFVRDYVMAPDPIGCSSFRFHIKNLQQLVLVFNVYFRHITIT